MPWFKHLLLFFIFTLNVIHKNEGSSITSPFSSSESSSSLERSKRSPASYSTQYFEKSPNKNITIARGSSIQIPCKVRNRQGECLWLHDGKGIGIIRGKYEFRRSPENGDCDLTIHDVSLDSDDGDWQCQVTAAQINQETLQSQVIRLLVLISPERPTILRNYQQRYTPDFQVIVHDPNVIECAVSNGNPPPKVSWLLNGRNITQYADTTLTKNPSTYASSALSKLSRYQIRREENRQNLTCYSEHPAGNQADSVTLNVLYRPIVNVSRERYSVMEGVELRIPCQVDANPPASVTWRRLNSRAEVPTFSRTDPNIIYYDRVPRELDGAKFECIAQNEFGSSEAVVVQVDVLYTPRLQNTSNTQTVTTGSPAKLYCNYEGNPRPSIKWYHINPRSGEASHVPNYGRDQSVLDIENATYSHEGEYYCEATNQINTVDYVVRSTNIILDVHGLPAFLTKSPFNTEGKRGGQSEVSLWFCADPAPSNVYWKFGSIQLDAMKRFENMTVPTRYVVKPIMPLGSKRSLEAASNCYDSTLLIKDTDISDERDYVLFIENERGHQEGVVQLRVVNPLPLFVLIAIALSFVIIVVVIFVFLCIVRKRKGDESIRDHEEAKEDAQALSAKNHGSRTDNNDAELKGERHELVYANLEFDKQGSGPQCSLQTQQHQPMMMINTTNGKNKQKPIPRPKPQISQRHHPQQPQAHQSSRPAANSTEYAQIAFSNRTEL